MLQKTGAVKVRPAQRRDEQAWRGLWDGYCRFYQVEIAGSVTDLLWRRICDHNFPIHALIAEDRAGRAAGFANYVLHPYTWGTGLICYLEDLFVAEAARGQGAGSALINALIGLSHKHGWARLYWNTHATNDNARRLYDRFTPMDNFVRYTIRIET
jgi:GNAT superfamily N-acetyltransferase